MESKLEEGQRYFCPGWSTKDQIFTLKQILGVWQRSLCMLCWSSKKHMTEFLGINFGRFCWSMALMQLLCDIKSFYCWPEVCVRVNGKQSKPFQHVGVGLRQRYVLSTLLFIVYMNWINKCCQVEKCATIGSCKISHLLFAGALVLPQHLACSAYKIALQMHLTPPEWKQARSKLMYFTFQETLISAGA